MQYRPLGKNGPAVSIIGFGAWAIGGKTHGNTSYGETSDIQSLSALEAAIEEGINFFDTAIAYGDGHSEALLAKTAQKHGDKMIIASKAGFQSFNAAQDFSSDTLKASVKQSVRRFSGRPLDLLQLHSPPLDILKTSPEIFDCLAELQSTGMTKHLGMSLKNPSDAFEALALSKKQGVQFASIQINFNMMDMRAHTEGLLDHCQKEGIGVIARTPLCFGFLSGQITKETTFPDGDHRNGWSSAQINRWIEGADELLAIARMNDNVEEKDVSDNISLALRFCFSHPAVSSVIPGILTPAEARMNAAIGSKEALSAQTLAEIREVYEQNSYFVSG